MISRLGIFRIGPIQEPSDWHYTRYSHSGHRGTSGMYSKYQNRSNREKKRRTKWNITHNWEASRTPAALEDLRKCEDEEEWENQEPKNEMTEFLNSWQCLIQGRGRNQESKSKTHQKEEYVKNWKKELMSEKERWGKVDEKDQKSRTRGTSGETVRWMTQRGRSDVGAKRRGENRRKFVIDMLFSAFFNFEEWIHPLTHFSILR